MLKILTGLSALIIAAGAAFTYSMKQYIQPQLNTSSQTNILLSEALAKYCEDPKLLETYIAKAKLAGETEKVKNAEIKKKEITCVSVVKKSDPANIKPTSIIVTNNETGWYNNHYWCESDNNDKCEMCFINDNNEEKCCYKSSADIASGNDMCGPNDEKFPPNKKTVVGQDRIDQPSEN